MADITIAWDAANNRGDWVLNPPVVTQTPIVVASPQQFAVGDGVATQFALVFSQSAISNVVAQIFRNDWQGNQLLYATPRTNALGQSENLSASWTITRASLTQPGLKTLRGALAYKLVEDSSATTTHFIQRTSTGTFNIGERRLRFDVNHRGLEHADAHDVFRIAVRVRSCRALGGLVSGVVRSASDIERRGHCAMHSRQWRHVQLYRRRREWPVCRCRSVRTRVSVGARADELRLVPDDRCRNGHGLHDDIEWRADSRCCAACWRGPFMDRGLHAECISAGRLSADRR
jgi:hypothetical protein